MADALRRKIQARPKTPTISSRKSEDAQDAQPAASRPDASFKLSMPKFSNFLSVNTSQVPAKPEPFSTDQWSIESQADPPSYQDVDHIMQAIMIRLMNRPYDELPADFNVLLRRLLGSHSALSKTNARLQAQILQITQDYERQLLELRTQVEREKRSRSDGHHRLRTRFDTGKGKSEDLLCGLWESKSPWIPQPLSPRGLQNIQRPKPDFPEASKTRTYDNFLQASTRLLHSEPGISQPAKPKAFLLNSSLSSDSLDSFSTNEDAFSDIAPKPITGISDVDFAVIRRLAEIMALHRNIKLEDAMRRIVETFQGPDQTASSIDLSKQLVLQRLGIGTDGTGNGVPPGSAAFTTSPTAIAGYRDRVIGQRPTTKPEELSSATCTGQRRFSFDAGEDSSTNFSVVESSQDNRGSFETQLNVGPNKPTPPHRPSYFRNESSSRIPSPVYESPMTIRRRRGSSSLGASLHQLPSTPEKRSSDATTSSVSTVIRAPKDRQWSFSEGTSLRSNDGRSSALAIAAVKTVGSDKKQKDA